jgi:hypothetical protein
LGEAAPISVTGCVCEKIAKNAAQTIFVKIKTKLLPWKKYLNS